MSSEDLSKYNCIVCKDTELIIYRIHSEAKEFDQHGWPLDPAQVITEEEFFSGKISPEDALLWMDTLAKRCECVKRKKKQKEMDRILASSNLSPKFQKRRFDTLIWLDIQDFEKRDWPEVEQLMAGQRKAYETVLNYCINFDSHRAAGHGFGLFGDYGTAKTHLLAAAVNYLLERGIQAVHVNTAEILQEIRETFELDEDGKPLKEIRGSEIIDLIKKCEYLSLDDLGTEKPTEWVKEKFYEILNYRYEHELSTSFSTNNTLEELKLHLGKSYRRLIEPSMGRMVIIKGTSFDQLLVRKKK